MHLGTRPVGVSFCCNGSVACFAADLPSLTPHARAPPTYPFLVPARLRSPPPLRSPLACGQGSYTPVFNEEFFFKGVGREDMIIFEMFDWDAGQGDDNDDFMGAFCVDMVDVIDGLEELAATNPDDDEIDTWLDLQEPEASWGLKHDMTMEGGLAIQIKGCVRIKIKYAMHDDLDEDLSKVTLVQTIANSALGVVISNLGVVLESEIEMLDNCGADVTSAPVLFPHACSTSLVIAGRVLANLQSCVDLLIRVRHYHRRQEQLASQALDKVRQGIAAAELAAMRLQHDKRGSAPGSGIPAHKAKRMREEENDKLDTLRQRTATITSLTDMLRTTLDTMRVIVRAGTKVAVVLCDRHDEVSEAFVQVLISDRQTFPRVSSMEQVCKFGVRGVRGRG